jgi:putative phage-type endonuclease
MISNKESFIARPHGIGGSDVAAMLGLSPYKTPVQLWAEKVGLQQLSQKDQLHLRFGRHLEPFLAQEYEKGTGLLTEAPEGPMFHPEHRFMFASIDRLVYKSNGEVATGKSLRTAERVLECKTASVFNRKDWGEAGTDQVPAHYLLQCAWYLAISRCEFADIAVLIGNSDFRVYTVLRDHRLERMLLEQAKKFWQDNVLNCRPPRIKTEKDARILYPKQVTDQIVEADTFTLDLVQKYLQAVRTANLAKDEAEIIKAQIMECIGTAQEVRHCGRPITFWRESKPARRLDLQALRLAHPSIAEEFTTTGPAVRRLVIKENI